jgi:hypothetical protein
MATTFAARAATGQTLAGATSTPTTAKARQNAGCPANSGFLCREGQSGANTKMEKAELRGAFLGRGLESSGKVEKQARHKTRAATSTRAALAAPPADIEKDGKQLSEAVSFFLCPACYRTR